MNNKNDKKKISEIKFFNVKFKIIRHYEVGLILKGKEIPCINKRHCSLEGNYIQLKDGVYRFILNFFCGCGNEKRYVSLLLQKYEKKAIKKYLKQKYYTVLISSLYKNNHLVKGRLTICILNREKLWKKRLDQTKNKHDII